MRRALEVFFRQPLRFLALLMLLPLLGVAYEYKTSPKVYQATATLWALHRYIIIGATGPETNLDATPADTQTAALSELLLSESFTQIIAKATNLASTLKLTKAAAADPQFVADSVFVELAHGVKVASQGYNLYTVSYSSRDPQMAQKVVQAVIAAFAAQSETFSLDEARQ